MEDELSVDGWKYWLRLPTWPLDVALTVLTGYDPRGANHRHYFKHNTRAPILSDHFIWCGLSSASYDEERKVTSIDADPKPPQKWIDAFLLMDDAKLPFPLPDSDQEKTDLNPAEYKTLYRMLAAMAIDAYGFDPDKERQKATGEIIKAFAKAGLTNPDPETIRKHLKIAIRESGTNPHKT
ncbi:MAG: hypothetical protein Q8O38_10685 [Sulfurimicrobium sp.]|nr:hypothetical protein [Sulfurimicrobium sp.]